jgi:hypothetical protein
MRYAAITIWNGDFIRGSDAARFDRTGAGESLTVDGFGYRITRRKVQSVGR